MVRAGDGAADGRCLVSASHEGQASQRTTPQGHRSWQAHRAAAASPRGMPGITGLIRDNHNRMRRVFSALDDVARYAATGGQWMLGRTWARLADLLEPPATAEQTCCLAGAAVDSEHAAQAAAPDYGEVRQAVRQAGVLAGCPAWWHAVAAARRAASQHIDHAEQASRSQPRDPLTHPSGQWAQHRPSQAAMPGTGQCAAGSSDVSREGGGRAANGACCRGTGERSGRQGPELVSYRQRELRQAPMRYAPAGCRSTLVYRRLAYRTSRSPTGHRPGPAHGTPAGTAWRAGDDQVT